MNKNIMLICLSILIILIAGGASKNETNLRGGNVGASCNAHEECKTSIEYSIKNDCPHYSLCIKNRCTVVCPRFLWSDEDPDHPHDDTPYTSPSVKCKVNSECDASCSSREDIYHTTKGACVESNCYCIMAE